MRSGSTARKLLATMAAASHSYPRRAAVRLVTYRSTVEAAARLGAVVDDLVVDVGEAGQHAGVSLPSSMLDFIDLGPPALAALKKILNEGKDNWPVGVALPLVNVRLLAPIPQIGRAHV